MKTENIGKVDAAINIFAKPLASALSLLSLLRFSGPHIDRIYLQFEPYGSRFDTAAPFVIAQYLQERLGDRIIVSQPGYWLARKAPEREKLDDPAYRLGIRYEYAFERTNKKYLFILHNDVLIKADIIEAMLERIGGCFAVGSIGQCWNCPAKDEQTALAAGFPAPCSPDSYADFQPDFSGLRALYAAALRTGRFVRPYWQSLEEHYQSMAWPLPECRVNEWSCMVDVEQTRALVIPQGNILPFGAFEQCGPLLLDTAAAWFRDLNRKGLRARNMDLQPYLTHWVGTGKKTAYRYAKAESNAGAILKRHFPDFADWCRKKDNRMFL
ncbi:MAG: hypothetical protein LBU06_06805 [Desulfovibrio sp.]|nr:hypothetical protein [Desulfovibrio sp.]